MIRLIHIMAGLAMRVAPVCSLGRMIDGLSGQR
jgi:hypothetical protein